MNLDDFLFDAAATAVPLSCGLLRMRDIPMEEAARVLCFFVFTPILSRLSGLCSGCFSAMAIYQFVLLRFWSIFFPVWLSVLVLLMSAALASWRKIPKSLLVCDTLREGAESSKLV